MKILVVTQDAPIYIPQFLDDFFNLLKKKHQVDSIVVFSAYQKNILAEIIYRLRFYGFRDFFKMLILILKSKLKSYLFNGGKCYSVTNVIIKNYLKQKLISSPNDPKFIKYVKDGKIDLIVSIASPKIFKNQILKAPKRGCINYHTGMLPKYRGVTPLFWALLNNEKKIGITIHFMDEKIDNGSIIVQKNVVIDNDSLNSLFEKTIKFGPDILVQAIDRVALGQKKFIINDPKKATYFGFPTPADAKKFKSKGKRFF